MQEISWKTYKLREADSRPKLAQKLCFRVLKFKTDDEKVSISVYVNFLYDTIHVFTHQKTDKQSKNCLLLSKISQSNCKWLFFAVKYGMPYGSIRDSEQLCIDTIWGYPEYGASNCVRYVVSPGLDGLIKIQYTSNAFAKIDMKQHKNTCFSSYLWFVWMKLRSFCIFLSEL